MDKFWKKVDKSGDCWLWMAGKLEKGYGQFWFDGRTHRAHRMAWLLTNGEIPEGMCVLHKCDNPPCVNPSHLWLGTNQDNMDDMNNKGRNWNSNRTHCPKNHPYDEKNTRSNVRFPQRACKACEKQRNQVSS